MIEATPRAREILSRSLQAARRFNPDVVIRVIRGRAGIEAALADAAEQDDEPLDVGGATVYVAAGLDGMLDGLDPHEQLVLRPG